MLESQWGWKISFQEHTHTHNEISCRAFSRGTLGLSRRYFALDDQLRGMLSISTCLVTMGYHHSHV